MRRVVIDDVQVKGLREWKGRSSGTGERSCRVGHAKRGLGMPGSRDSAAVNSGASHGDRARHAFGEYFSERRHFNVALPKLVDDLRASGNMTSEDTRSVILSSGLLARQKRLLCELTCHPDVTPEMRESLAVGLEFKEQRRYDGTVKITDVAARVAPLLGLLGTLIPLGPGIMALGSGDTETLSASLLTAFDTTSLGLIIAGFCVVMSAVRKRWYKEYMVNFDAAMECVLEVEKNRGTDVFAPTPTPTPTPTPNPADSLFGASNQAPTSQTAFTPQPKAQRNGHLSQSRQYRQA